MWPRWPDVGSLEQLTSAANSASEFAAWVLQEYRCQRAPLRSLRVLLSPSKGEAVHPAIAALLPNNHAATIANVTAAIGEFKKAADRYSDNLLLVYIAGHGVQLTKTGAIVLLEDFAGPEQLHALPSMTRGMPEKQTSRMRLRRR